MIDNNNKNDFINEVVDTYSKNKSQKNKYSGILNNYSLSNLNLLNQALKSAKFIDEKEELLIFSFIGNSQYKELMNEKLTEYYEKSFFKRSSFQKSLLISIKATSKIVDRRTIIPFTGVALLGANVAFNLIKSIYTYQNNELQEFHNCIDDTKKFNLQVLKLKINNDKFENANLTRKHNYIKNILSIYIDVNKNIKQLLNNSSTQEIINLFDIATKDIKPYINLYSKKSLTEEEKEKIKDLFGHAFVESMKNKDFCSKIISNIDKYEEASYGSLRYLSKGSQKKIETTLKRFVGLEITDYEASIKKAQNNMNGLYLVKSRVLKDYLNEFNELTNGALKFMNDLKKNNVNKITRDDNVIDWEKLDNLYLKMSNITTDINKKESLDSVFNEIYKVKPKNFVDKFIDTYRYINYAHLEYKKDLEYLEKVKKDNNIQEAAYKLSIKSIGYLLNKSNLIMSNYSHLRENKKGTLIDKCVDWLDSLRTITAFKKLLITTVVRNSTKFFTTSINKEQIILTHTNQDVLDKINSSNLITGLDLISDIIHNVYKSDHVKNQLGIKGYDKFFSVENFDLTKKLNIFRNEKEETNEINNNFLTKLSFFRNDDNHNKNNIDDINIEKKIILKNK